MQLLFLFFLFIATFHFNPPNIFAQCTYVINPVNSAPYTGTPSDFQNGYSALYRDTYTDTTATYFEGIGSHPGVDIIKDSNGNSFTTNTQMVSICEGTIERVTEAKKKNGGWGNSLTIRHNITGVGTVFSVYAHLDRFLKQWREGDPVKLGEPLGFVGTTGKSTGIHLHFQIDKDINYHPFFPNRFPGYNDGTLEVNTPDSDNYVLNNTIDPIAFVQAHQAPPPTESPWPMFQHDPQHTGQSPYVGPQTNNLKWTFLSVGGPMAIGQNGVIYIGGPGAKGAMYSGNLYAINPDGSLKWKSPDFSALPSSPAIAPDGTIYVGTMDFGSTAYALNPNDGSIKWSYGGVDAVYYITLGNDGTIYFTSEMGNLYALNPDGTLKWKYGTGQWSVGGSAPAIALDGTIYVTGGLWLYAINPDGTLKWQKGFHWSYSYLTSVSIATDGTVYFGHGVGISAVDFNGNTIWNYSPVISCGGNTSGWRTSTVPAITKDGSIIIGFRGESFYNTTGLISSINPDGSTKWNFCLDVGEAPYTPALGSDSTIYIGVSNDTSTNANIFALDQNGLLKWEYPLGNSFPSANAAYSTPVIGDGSVYISAYSGTYPNTVLYAFGQ